MRKGTSVRYSGHEGKFKGQTGKIVDFNGARQEWIVEFPVSKKITTRTFVPISKSVRTLKAV